MSKRVAIYCRVSTASQTCENQLAELRAVADRAGYTIVKEYVDDGISGICGRDKRPALDEMLNDCQKRRFEQVMCLSIDRLGRSVGNLIEVINTIQSMKVDVWFLRQNIDTSTNSGKLMFQMFACLAEYERSMILERTELGRRKAIEKGVKFGRPRVVTETTRQAVRLMREQGVAIKKIAVTMNLGISTVYAALN